MRAAEAIGTDDPDQALEFLRQLLKMKFGGVQIEMAYENLRQSSPQRANQFLRDAISAARADYDPMMLEALAGMLDEFDTQPASAPEELRPAILGVIAEAMLRPAQTEDDQNNLCRTSLSAARVLAKFPPDVAGPVLPSNYAKPRCPR